MIVGGKKCERCQSRDSRLTDPDFTIDTHGGYCTVRIRGIMSIVIINNEHFVEVEAYENTEDDAPMDSMIFTKEIL